VPNSVHFLLFFFTEIISQPIERSKVLFEIIIYRKYLQYTETGRKQKISLRKTKYSTVIQQWRFDNFFSGSGFWRAKRIHNSSAIRHVNMCENRDVSWARINFHDEMKN